MKLTQFILALVCTLLMQIDTQAQTTETKLQNIDHAFEALPQKQQAAYEVLKKKAYTEYRKEKYMTCLIAIFDAQAIFNQDIELTFLKGVCYAQFSDIKNAITCYHQVLEINPKHVLALVNLIEINYFAANYLTALKHTEHINKIINEATNPVDNARLPLLHFKYLISLIKLSEQNPEKYKDAIEMMKGLYTYMDDQPFHYYSKALALLQKGDKKQAYAWLMRAYRVFRSTDLIHQWNKPLVDAGYLEPHEFMFVRRGK